MNGTIQLYCSISKGSPETPFNSLFNRRLFRGVGDVVFWRNHPKQSNISQADFFRYPQQTLNPF